MYYVPKVALNKQKFDIDLKIDRLDSSQNFTDTAKTIDLIRLCIQVTNTVVFKSYTHQTYKEIQNKIYVNSKPKVY